MSTIIKEFTLELLDNQKVYIILNKRMNLPLPFMVHQKTDNGLESIKYFLTREEQIGYFKFYSKANAIAFYMMQKVKQEKELILN